MAEGSGGLSRTFWVRLEGGPGGSASDAFRVRFRAPEGVGQWQQALVEDLKEQMLLQAHALFEAAAAPAFGPGSRPPLPCIHLWVPPRPEGVEGGREQGEGEKEREAQGEGHQGVQLSASDELSRLPAEAGTASWHLVARVSRPPGAQGAVAAEPRRPRPANRPLTLFEQGLAGKDEPEQIKNATDLSELYPGGVLPPSGHESNLIVVLKLLLVFVLAIGFCSAITYILGHALPGWLEYASDNTTTIPNIPSHGSEL